MPREYTSLQTTPLEALMDTLVVNTYEGWDIAAFSVPGDYLDSYMPDNKDTRLKLEGGFADIMCGVNPNHIHNIIYENKEEVVYLRILKTLYGCI